jgi:hypothetical protein
MSGWGLLLCNLIPNPIFFSRCLWSAIAPLSKHSQRGDDRIQAPRTLIVTLVLMGTEGSAQRSSNYNRLMDLIARRTRRAMAGETDAVSAASAPNRKRRTPSH